MSQERILRSPPSKGSIDYMFLFGSLSESRSHQANVQVAEMLFYLCTHACPSWHRYDSICGVIRSRIAIELIYVGYPKFLNIFRFYDGALFLAVLISMKGIVYSRSIS